MRYFLIFIIFLFSCKEEKALPKPLDNNNVSRGTSARKVSVVLLKNEIFNNQIIATGRVTALEKSKLYFKKTDKLVYINIINGERVKKGQLLGRLENDLLANTLNNAKLSLAKVNLQFNETKLKYGIDNLTPTILKNLKVKSGIFEAKNNLQRAQIEYNQTLLIAPFSGVIANLDKKNNDFISSSEPFCTLINPNNLEIFFSVLETEFNSISQGQEIKIQSYTNEKKVFKGVISQINPQVDSNGLIKVKATIVSKNTNLLDGMNVKVFINKPLEDVLVIPKEGLILRSNREVVFTVENNLAKWNYVEVAGENSNSYAIKKGLKTTDTIVVSGNLNLSHDAKVNVSFANDISIQK